MADKLMYISNDDTQNYPFCKFKLVIETLEHLTKSTNQLIKIHLSLQSC